MTDQRDDQPSTWPVLGACAFVALSVCAVYYPVQEFDFVSLDDPGYVSENTRVLSGLSIDNFRWAFSTIDRSNWHPLTWLSYMIDVEIYGVGPGGQHISNVLLHTMTSIVLMLTLLTATKQLYPSALVAVLFAVHPMHVESVAWISERKDVLSGLFWMSALLVYVRYARQPSWKSYLWVLFFSVCALMSKPMAITLPFTLLLLDYWPLQRIRVLATAAQTPPSTEKGETPSLISLRQALIEKWPLFVLSVASGGITLLAQQHGGAVVDSLTLGDRLLNASVSYAVYFYKLVVPFNLSAFYPYPATVNGFAAAGALLLLGAITFLSLRFRRRAPYLLCGWLWFLGTLVPVIGLVQVGLQSRADRYTYIPYIGLFIMLAWSVTERFRLVTAHRLTIAVGTVALVLWLGLLASLQVGVWRNTVSLWHHAIAVTKDNFFAHYHLGRFFERNNNLELALMHFTKTVELVPFNADAHTGLGVVRARRGELIAAEREFQKALRLDPGHRDAAENLQRVQTQLSPR